MARSVDDSDAARMRSIRTRAVLVFAVSVHLVFLLSLFTGWLNPLFVDSTYRVGRGADYYSLHQAGRNFVDGVDIYDWNRQTAIPYGYPYRYVPFLALTAGVISQAVPAPTAYWTWIVLLESMLVLNIWLTRELAPDRTKADIASAMWLLFTPFYLELYMGQFSFFMITLVFWSLYFWRSGREKTGDALWILSLLAKSFSALFGAVLVRQKRWGALAVGVAATLALTAPYFVWKPESFREFWDWNVGGLNPFMIGGNQGVAALTAAMVVRAKGLWPHVTAYPPPPDIAALIARSAGSYDPWLTALALIAVAVGLYVNFKAPGGDPGPLVLFWIVTYFVFFKTVWEHQYVMMLPVFALMYLSPDYFRGRAAIPLWAFWTAFVVIALPTPVLFLHPGFGEHALDPEYAWTALQSLTWHAGKPFATILIWGFMIRRLLAAPVAMVPMLPLDSPWRRHRATRKVARPSKRRK